MNHVLTILIVFTRPLVSVWMKVPVLQELVFSRFSVVVVVTPMVVRIVRQTIVLQAVSLLPFLVIARVTPRRILDVFLRESATLVLNRGTLTLGQAVFYQWVNPTVLKILSALDVLSGALKACAFNSNEFIRIHCFALALQLVGATRR